MVTVTMPGRTARIGGARPPVVERVRAVWERLYQIADEIGRIEELMERQAAWICRHRHRDDLAVYQARWNASDQRRLALHAEIETLMYRADRALLDATDADREELGPFLRDGGAGMAEWFGTFVPKRDIWASECPEEVSCDGHEF